jgi:hypothetical protein
MSSSDSEAGRELDPEPEEQPKPKAKRVVVKQVKLAKREELQPDANEIIQPIPSEPLPPPPTGKLTKLRREQIISEFLVGKEDPEYEVKQTKTGGYRVSKRKSFYTPSAKLDNPPNDDILDRFKRELREELKQHRAEWVEQKEMLIKKYKKLSARDKARGVWECPPNPAGYEPIVVPYVKPSVKPSVQVKKVPVRKAPPKRFDIHNF